MCTVYQTDRQSASMCEQLAVVRDRPHHLSNGHRPTIEPDRRHSIINFYYETDRQTDRQTDRRHQKNYVRLMISFGMCCVLSSGVS